MPIRVLLIAIVFSINNIRIYAEEASTQVKEIEEDIILEFEETPSEVTINLIKDPRKSLSFYYSPEFYKYKFSDTADPTGISLNNLGQNAGVSYSYWANKRWGLGAQLSHRFFFVDDMPAGTFPNSITGNFVQASLLVKTKLKKTEKYNKGFSAYAIYQYSLFDIELTTPLQMTDYTSHSLGIGLIYQTYFSNNKRLTVDASYSPSLTHKEGPSDSGKRDHSSNLSGQIKFIVPWDNKWDIFFSYQYSMRKLNFIGTGTRGTTNAEQREIVHAPKIGLIYEL
jgi:hypothetical protein